jgi:hypothetical protein
MEYSDACLDGGLLSHDDNAKMWMRAVF